jgi:hypothetical protein
MTLEILPDLIYVILHGVWMFWLGVLSARLIFHRDKLKGWELPICGVLFARVGCYPFFVNRLVTKNF